MTLDEIILELGQLKWPLVDKKDISTMTDENMSTMTRKKNCSTSTDGLI